ncbi:hypothetical protein EXIGLDRAFT_707275 [Exidia glandulosa HHB12029]|uniref:Ricin B lectin domain-containing protein n=1 Tax=Exidia glandulosa HHB12029 TaxID=1314781 RepID=A0A165JVQ3_EXIGL|nr:hypothetical protein EXIGLDRAFT_707275 [Exidia glandulosa HHB12029]
MRSEQLPRIVITVPSPTGPFFVTAFSAPNLGLSLKPFLSQAGEWAINPITPVPASYLLSNTDNGLALAAPFGGVNAVIADPRNASHLWRLAGTGPGSSAGTLQNVKTGRFLDVNGGVLTTGTSTQQWSLSLSGGAARLSQSFASPPNVVSVTSTGAVILDNAGATGDHQFWTFIPSDTSIAV